MNEIERKAVHEMLKRRSAERTGSADAAREWLIGEGMYDGEGRLVPQYGGRSVEDDGR